MYKLRYGRTFNIGNYQSERIEIERDFNDEESPDKAAELLATEINIARAGTKIDRKVLEASLAKMGVPPPRYKDMMEKEDG